MKAKVKHRHSRHDVPARRESDFVEHEQWQGGGYFEFQSDSSGCDTIRLSLEYVKTLPGNYDLIEQEG